MATVMKGEILLPATREMVWDKLNDPAVLKTCIPGCQSLEKDGDTLLAVAKVKVGPVSATFKGRVELKDLNPPTSYTIEGAGEGGVAGFAKGSARVELSDTEAGCLLVYDVTASVGGKMAQLGGRLIDGVAKKNADEFFQKFSREVGGGETVSGG